MTAGTGNGKSNINGKGNCERYGLKGSRGGCCEGSSGSFTAFRMTAGTGNGNGNVNSNGNVNGKSTGQSRSSAFGEGDNKKAKDDNRKDEMVK
jgi:hypothetical protein